MKQAELQEVLTLHALWLENDDTGQKADLQKADLLGADLRDANLLGADLQYANLQGANLQNADLQSANLYLAKLQGANLLDAKLRWANLRGARLRKADLQKADLQGADLRWAILQDANLQSADLRRTNLQDANLRRADLRKANLQRADLQDAYLLDARLDGAKLPHFQIPQNGTLTVYTKVKGRVIKLLIPAKAKRTASLVGRECRAEYVKVLRIEGGEPVSTRGLTYVQGETVYPDSYDSDIRVECANGVHFFLTEIEAKEYWEHDHLIG